MCVGVTERTTGVVRPLMHKPSQEDNNEYLLVQNARRTPLEDALNMCGRTEGCTFLCHTAQKKFDTKGHAMEPPEAGNIPQSDATWMCSGSGWTALYPKNGWVTAIKGTVLQQMCRPFRVWLNQRAECGNADLLDVARDLTPKEATSYCASTKGCRFFTMSLETHDSTMAFGTVVHFCKGVPKKRVARDGHFFAAVGQEEIETVKVTSGGTTSRIGLYYGGPLTNDGYYDDKTPGSLVPAMNL
ncbi:PAN domain, putative [Babesia ovis]|uniref:PAN domain, putative n=1 Tax=Babesia ovis TaxID=5869 RepID=A0A9W5WVZ8_BABOV|nr:PAN domain, putative [Babesia ovis]